MELKSIKGIGIVYEKKLNEAGIETVEDLVLADLKEVSERTGISVNRLREWKKKGRKVIPRKKAIVREDVAKIATIEITDSAAKVTIKGVPHENIPVYRGKFEDVRAEMVKREMAVHLGTKATLWFNQQWYENVPYSVKSRPQKEEKVPERSFFEKLKEWWRK